MITRLSSLAPAAGNAAGQAIWAAGQMAVLILMSHQGLLRLIGIYSIGIGIFAVVTLLLGLNLRVAVSTDRSHAIGFRSAILARTAACLVALPIAIGGMALTGPSADELLISSVLVAARVPDQLSDVVIGYYVRDGRRTRISRSFLLRGIAAVMVVALAWMLGWTMAIMALAMVVAMSLVTALFDLIPQSPAATGTGTGRSLRQLIGETWKISPYPALDSLHINSLRFAMVMVTGPAFYGLVAIAQVLYTPFQIAMSALGFGYLETARGVHDGGSHRDLRRHVRLGLLLGGGIGAGFVLTCLLLPDAIVQLLFADQADEARGPLIVTAIAIGLSPLCGFLSLCVVTGANRASYLAAPLAGLAVVWAGTPLLLLTGFARLAGHPYQAALMVAWLFAASYILRLYVSLRALGAATRAGTSTAKGSEA